MQTDPNTGEVVTKVHTQSPTPDRPFFVTDIKIGADRRSAIVTVGSNYHDISVQRELLTGRDASEIACQAAIAAGLPPTTAFGGYASQPYPVTSSGQVVGTVEDENGVSLPLSDPRNFVRGFRIDIQVK